jgi:hypothetical protein
VKTFQAPLAKDLANRRRFCGQCKAWHALEGGAFVRLPPQGRGRRGPRSGWRCAACWGAIRVREGLVIA